MHVGQIASGIAAFCFGAVIPTVVSMMWPSISPTLGWSIITISLVIGCFAAAYAIGWRTPPGWRLKIEGQPEWLPLVGVRDLATKAGWKIDYYDANPGYEFCQSMRQAAVHGKLHFQGRRVTSANWPEHYKTEEPLIDVPQNHFVDFTIHPLTFLGSNSNYQTYTTKLGKMMLDEQGEQNYRDLHVKVREIKKWLTPVWGVAK